MSMLPQRLAATFLCGISGPAAAQSIFPSTSTSTTQTFQSVADTVAVGTRQQTTILGLLPGQGTISSVTVQDAFGSTASNRAVAAAGNAVSVAAAPVRVRLSDPTLIGRSVQTGVPFGTRTATTTTNGAVTEQAVSNIPTGTTYQAGARGICASAGSTGGFGAGGNLPSGCQTGTAVTVPTRDISGINTNTNTPQLVLTTTTTELGTLATDTYGVTGTPIVQIGTVHALTRIGAIDDISRLMNRGLDEAMDPQRLDGDNRPWIGFVEGYGGFGRSGANGLVPGGRSEFGGMTAGLGGVVTPGFTLGWLVDHSRNFLRTTDRFAPENSTLDLTKTGPYGSVRLGDLNIGFLGALGQGSTDTSNGSEEAGGVARAGYDVRVATGGMQFAYDLSRVLSVPFSPQLGYQYARVETDGFTETGSAFALRGLSGNSAVQRYWAGVVYEDTHNIGQFRLQARGYLRFTQTTGDTDGAAGVVLASNPGGSPLSVSGPRNGDSAAEFGFRLRLPLLAGNVQLAYDGRSGGAGSSNVFTARARFEF